MALDSGATADNLRLRWYGGWELMGRFQVRFGLVLGFALGASGLFSALPAKADDPASNDGYVDALKVCQSIDGPSDRLACFDQAAANIVSAVDAGDLRLVDREEGRKTRRSLFGFSVPDLGLFGKRDTDGEDKDEIRELETTIASVSGSHGSGYTIRTAEGAVWRINDVPRRLLEPRVGDELLIKDGALSAYFIRINNQGGVKAARVR